MKKNFRGFRFLLILVLFATFPLTETAWPATPEIASGYYHTVALMSDGTLSTWGGNSRGQLGDGTNTDRNLPTQIGSDHKWASVSAG